jgi:hypothetical protein
MSLLKMIILLLALAMPIHAQQPAAQAEQVLTLGTGATVKCKILSSNDTAVTIQYQVNAGQAPQTREVAWAEVLHIDFTLDDEFHQLLATTTLQKDSIKMLARWQQDRPMLSRPKHPIGDLGLAFARQAITHPDELLKRKALELCSEIQFSDWSNTRRDHARWLRIRLLDTLKQTADAASEADFFSKDEQADPLLLMNAHLYLAENKHQALRDLERDNPLWEEDDLVRPDREALFHASLDHYLRPSLFFGTLEDTATRGLWGAVQLLTMDQDIPAAGDRARDIIQLYPASKLATEAQNFLALHKLPLEPPEIEPEPATGAPAAATATPPEEEREPIVTRRTRHTKPPEPSPKPKP